MYCKKCGTYNSNDSLICKKCGDYFVNQYLNDDLDINNDYSDNEQSDNQNNIDNRHINDDNNSNKSNSKKSKNKKTKSSKKKKNKKDKKGFFNRSRETDNKEKSRRNSNKNDKEVVVKNGCFSNVVIIFLVIFIFILMAICGVLGIYILNDKFVKVPDVIGLTEKDASKVLDDNGISYVVKEEKTTDTNEFGIVTSQDKEAGKYILKSSTVTIIIGSYNDSNNSNNTNNTNNNDDIILDNLVGKTKEEATNILDNNNINYDIIEIESSEEDGIVVKQSISAGKVITDDTVLTIYISKHVDSYDDNNVTNNTDTSTLDNNNTNNN